MRFREPVTAGLAYLGSVVAVVVMTTVYFLLPADLFGPHRPVVGWTLLGFSLTAIAVLLIVRTGDILSGRDERRPGLVLGVLMCLTVLVFASAYLALAQRPGELRGLETRLDGVYFTLVSLATVGYGDIVPRGQDARLVTILQILYTLVFLTAAGAAVSAQMRAVAARARR